MNCEDVLKIIQRYLDGELNEQEIKSLEEHAETCEVCKKQICDYEFIMNELEYLDIDIDALDDEISTVRHKTINNLFSDSPKVGIKGLVQIQEKSIKSTFIFVKFLPGKNTVRESAKVVSKATKETSKLFLKVGFRTLRARLSQ